MIRKVDVIYNNRKMAGRVCALANLMFSVCLLFKSINHLLGLHFIYGPVNNIETFFLTQV